jgi:AraC-like DNA-binding protein
MATDAPPLVVALPEGIPHFSSPYGRVALPSRVRPVRLLFHDWDVFWVRRGEVTWTLRDGRRLVAGPDQFVVLPPFVSAMVSPTRSPTEWSYCHFNFRQPPEVLPDPLRRDFAGPGKRALVPLAFSRSDAPGVHAAYRAIDRIRLDDDAQPWQLERAVLALIAALAVFSRRRTAAGGPGIEVATSVASDHRIAAVVQRIDRNPAHPWRVQSLARSVHLSCARFHELFRRCYDIGLKQYIVQARLHQALERLKQTRDGEFLSVKRVSQVCGFSSQQFFSRQFKAYFRVSPLAYRNGGGRDAPIP